MVVFAYGLGVVLGMIVFVGFFLFFVIRLVLGCVWVCDFTLGKLGKEVIRKNLKIVFFERVKL